MTRRPGWPTMEDSWPPGRLSELRLACEECHKRKIRCEAPRDGSQGICEACLVNRRRCLFSLKIKTGRPRKTDPKNDAGDIAHSSRRSPASTNGSIPDGTMVSPYQQPATPAQDVSSLQTPSHGSPPNHQGADYFAAMSERAQSQLPISPPSVERSFDSPDEGPPRFQNFESHAENILVEMLEPGYAPWPVAPAHVSSSYSHVHMSGSLFLDNSGTSSTGPSDGWREHRDDAQAAAAGDGVNDFPDVMQLCSEIHLQCQTRPLNMLADADQGELASMFRTIDDLSHKVAEVLARRNPSQSRQQQYQCMLLRVAVNEAIEIAAELVQFNLKVLRGDGDGTQRSLSGGFERRSSVQRQMSRSAVNPTASALEAVLSLCRLDHSLSQFGFFIASQNADQKRHRDACPSAYPGSDAGEQCHFSGLARTDQVRSQIWTLVEKLRNWRT